MPICYVNPDGSHVRGCNLHAGEHPYDWCDAQFERMKRRLAELKVEAEILQSQVFEAKVGDYNPEEAA